MMPIVLWLAIISAVAVYVDARRRQMLHPLGWALAVLLFWIVALPCYVRRRTQGRL